MIENVLREIRNFFIKDSEIVYGIESDGIVVSGAFMANQYVFVKGSIMNDGVHKITSVVADKIMIAGLVAEPTTIHLYALAIPKVIIDLTAEIEAYNEANTNGVVSESLGDYSVTYASDGGVETWQTAFKGKLNPYRRVYLDWYVRK